MNSSATEGLAALPLRVQRPPLCPELELSLVDPVFDLEGPVVDVLASEAPFWAFAWASGQVLARWLLDHPEHVRARRVVELGCGSGLVSIAAVRAGASRVCACDSDPAARAATSANAARNGARVVVTDALEAELDSSDVLLASDVLYDPVAARAFWSAASAVPVTLVADPERRPFDAGVAARLETLERRDAVTWPEIGEDARGAAVYRVVAPPEASEGAP